MALSATVLLVLVSLVCYRLNAGFAATAVVYFVIVALHSVVGGFAASVVLSIAASACLDYFFDSLEEFVGELGFGQLGK